LGKLSLWDRDQAWLAATERLVQQLEAGEVARAVCPALVRGFGRALLLATDRRLLGDRDGDLRRLTHMRQDRAPSAITVACLPRLASTRPACFE
jgi:hypothetical protein